LHRLALIRRGKRGWNRPAGFGLTMLAAGMGLVARSLRAYPEEAD